MEPPFVISKLFNHPKASVVVLFALNVKIHIISSSENYAQGIFCNITCYTVKLTFNVFFRAQNPQIKRHHHRHFHQLAPRSLLASLPASLQLKHHRKHQRLVIKRRRTKLR